LDSGRPGWANFRLFGNLVTSGSFGRITEVAQILWLFLPWLLFFNNLNEKWVGLYFSKTHLVTLFGLVFLWTVLGSTQRVKHDRQRQFVTVIPVGIIFGRA
jgi:hypothetical protein